MTTPGKRPLGGHGAEQAPPASRHSSGHKTEEPEAGAAHPLQRWADTHPSVDLPGEWFPGLFGKRKLLADPGVCSAWKPCTLSPEVPGPAQHKSPQGKRHAVTLCVTSLDTHGHCDPSRAWLWHMGPALYTLGPCPHWLGCCESHRQAAQAADIHILPSWTPRSGAKVVPRLVLPGPPSWCTGATFSRVLPGPHPTCSCIPGISFSEDTMSEQAPLMTSSRWP